MVILGVVLTNWLLWLWKPKKPKQFCTNYTLEFHVQWAILNGISTVVLSRWSGSLCTNIPLLQFYSFYFQNMEEILISRHVVTYFLIIWWFFGSNPPRVATPCHQKRPTSYLFSKLFSSSFAAPLLDFSLNHMLLQFPTRRGAPSIFSVA